MSYVGLAALASGLLALLYYFRPEFVPFLHVSRYDAMIVGAMLVSLGGLTFMVYRRQ